MFLFRTCCVAALSATAAASPVQTAPSYCVREVGTARGPASGFAAQSTGPSKILLGGEAATPLATDDVKVYQGEDRNRYQQRKALWSFGADGRIHGPQDIADFEVHGTDGRNVYLTTRREIEAVPPEKDSQTVKPPRLPTMETRFFIVGNGGPPRQLKGPLANPGWQYRVKRRARPGSPLVVLAYWDPPGKPQEQQTFLVSGERVVAIERDQTPPEHRFARWGIGVTTDDYSVKLHQLKSGASTLLELHHTDDFPHWESVNVDRYGWLFVEGYGNDYAIKLHGRGGDVGDHRVVRFTGRGFLGRIFEWLIGMNKGARISATHWSAQCVDYSQVLQLTLFCKPMQVLRHGRLKRIGRSAPLDRYIGDSTGARVALFRSKNQGLYAFDGNRVQLVARGVGHFPFVQDVPEAGRTFVTNGGRLWEVVGRAPNLRLRGISFGRSDGGAARIECCLNTYQASHARFVNFPGTRDVIAFDTVHGAWRLGAAGGDNLWQTGASGIDLDSIAPVGIWQGLLFSTMDRRHYLLKRCAA